MFRRNVLLCLLLLANTAQASGLVSAPLPFRHFGVADGLPSSIVMSMALDGDGYIWFATGDGLARFDGVETTVFRHDSERPGSLAANDVAAVVVDRAGRIWAGGEKSGVNRMEPGSNEFVHFRHSEDDPQSLLSDDVFALAEGVDGTMWVGQYGGLSAIYPDGRIQSWKNDPTDSGSLSSNFVISLRALDDGSVWIGGDQGLDVLGRDGRFRHVDLNLPKTLGGPPQVLAIWPESDGSVLVGSRGGLARISRDLKAGEPELTESVNSILRDRDGNLWTGVRGGLLLHGDGNVVRSAPREGLSGFLPGSRVSDIVQDREGGMWFSTVDGGVGRLLPHWRNFSIIRHVPGDAASLAHARTMAVAAGDGVTWIGSSDDGLDRVDATTGAVTRYGSHIAQTGNKILSVLQVAGKIWIGRFRGIQIFDPLQPGAGIINVPAGEDGTDTVPSGLILPMRLAADGAVWAVAPGSGLARIEPATLKTTRFDVSNQGIDSADIRDLAFGSDGTVWVVNQKGLQRLSPGATKFETVEGSHRSVIGGIAFAPDGQLWLHHEGGLERFTVTNAGLQSNLTVGIRDGLPSLTGAALTLDAAGAVWLTSTRGLWRFQPQSRELTAFTNGDGLDSDEFVAASLVQDANRRIWAATSNGVVSFQPENMRTDLPESPLRVIAANVRRDGVARTLDTASTIQLGHADRELTIDVRALSFAKPASNRYRFRLEGLDNDWIPTGARGERVITRLGAGDYRLQAAVDNGSGVWSSLPDPLNITVARAPWLSPWAYAVYVAMAALTISALLLLWRNRLRRRHELQLALQRQQSAEHVALAKSNFLTTMSHEIRTPLTGVIGMAELLSHAPLPPQQRVQVQAIQTSGDLLLRLVNDIVDLAQIEAGRLTFDSKPFDPVLVLHDCIELTRPLAEQRALALQLEAKVSVPAAVLGDAMRLRQVLLNLINNAIKFTEKGSVRVTLQATGKGTLRFTVEDSGPGMSAELIARLFQRFEQADAHAGRPGGSGLGLAISRELIELMGGHIDVESTLGVGSRFTFDVPFSDANLPAEKPSAVVANTQSALQVLIVEDEPIVAAVLAGFLEKLGHSSSHVSDGLAALAATRDEAFSLALIDLDLPGIAGLQLAGLLRQQEHGEFRRTLIAVTASFSASEQQALDAGMDGFLRKPVSAESLRTAIRLATAKSSDFATSNT